MEDPLLSESTSQHGTFNQVVKGSVSFPSRTGILSSLTGPTSTSSDVILPNSVSPISGPTSRGSTSPVNPSDVSHDGEVETRLPRHGQRKNSLATLLNSKSLGSV